MYVNWVTVNSVVIDIVELIFELEVTPESTVILRLY